MNQVIRPSAYLEAIQHFVEQAYLSAAQGAEMTAAQAGGLRSLIDKGLVPERAFAETLSQVYQSPIVLSEQLPNLPVEGTQDLASFLVEHEALPLSLQSGVLMLAMSDPSDEFTLQVLRAKLKCEIDTRVAVRSNLLEALASAYSANSDSFQLADSFELAHIVDLPDDLDSDSRLVRELHRMIQRAVSLNASDIHFEPVDLALRVRFRVHGMLREVGSFAPAQAKQVLARLKLMSKLDVTERRYAQNGRFKFRADGRMIDLRVSTLPLHDGESVVLRLLEFALSELSLQELGFRQSLADSLLQAINAQQGLVLITGPTGSGKSTTLYSLLNQLNQPQLKLLTIEDPVEMNIAGVNQIQVNEEYGISFSTALKTVLRQDPDIIMVGEIRDAETAQLAAQAALTGHLVLATLHTASSASAITRLQNLGLPEYLVSATVTAVLAQRLLRCKCQACAQLDDSAHATNSCKTCAGAKYSGRTPIAEFLPTSAFKASGEISSDVLATKLLDGMTLADDAQRLLANGVTDQAEILRVLGVHS